MATRLRPCNVTNAQWPSVDSVTPSGDGDPGTSAVATMLSRGMVMSER